MSLILRLVKGSALSYSELDSNFIYLSQSIVDITQNSSITLAGTDNYLAMFSASSTALTSSLLKQSGNTLQITGSLSVLGDVVAQQLVVNTVSSSISYSSGSNIFGNSLSNTQILTGSVEITGSLKVYGPTNLYGTTSITGATTINNLTGSLQGTASWAMNVINDSSAIRAFSSSLYSVRPAALVPDTTSYGSIFLLSGSGVNSTNAYSDIFIGSYSGFGATNTNRSIFLGTNSGYGSTSTQNSIFIGQSTGTSTNTAVESIFLGLSAGSNSNGVTRSNFIGSNVGGSVSVLYSNFIGYATGFLATNASNSNFIGNLSGYSATNASNSNFIGNQAGYYASSATYSNFIGYYAGSGSVNSSYSTYIGFNAGAGLSTLGSNNIIIGTNITLPGSTSNGINIGGLIFGSGSYYNNGNTPSSNSANGKIGINQPSPKYSLDVSGSGNYSNNLIVTGSITTNNSLIVSGSIISTGSINILGSLTASLQQGYVWVGGVNNITTLVSTSSFGGGSTTTPVITSSFNTIYSLFPAAGIPTTNESEGIFLGTSAGDEATNTFNSIFLGPLSGYYSINAFKSNFIGYNVGAYATNAYNSNFIGNQAGTSAAGSYNSNFIGQQAGDTAIDATNSNFIGTYAGQGASTPNSNFIGNQAGRSASNANISNFIGNQVGMYATYASSSNFIGNKAGFNASTAAYSNLFGYLAGAAIGGNSIGTNNIIIGTNITLEENRQDSINLGGIIFGTGSYSDINGNPYYGPANGKIGINQPLPTSTFQVSGSRAGRFVEYNDQSVTLGDEEFINYFISGLIPGITATLPAASTCPGRVYHIRNDGSSQSLIISPGYFPAGGGGAIGTLSAATTMTIVSNGINWLYFGS